MIKDNEARFEEALAEDLGRPKLETTLYVQLLDLSTRITC